MADLIAIEQKIVSLLQNIPDLKTIYDHEPKTLTALPAATLFFDGFDQNDQTTRQKQVNWRWILRLYIRVQDAEQAQADIKKLILATRKELASDPTFGNLCLYHTSTRGDVFVSIDQANVHMVAEIQLSTVTNEPY